MGRRHDMRRRKHPRGHRRHTFGPHWGGWVGRPIPYLVTGPVIDPRDGAEALRILHGIRVFFTFLLAATFLHSTRLWPLAPAPAHWHSIPALSHFPLFAHKEFSLVI